MKIMEFRVPSSILGTLYSGALQAFLVLVRHSVQLSGHVGVGSLSEYTADLLSKLSLLIVHVLKHIYPVCLCGIFGD